MNESAQTSVEQINLVAAQLRYKIDSTLQQTSQQRQHVHIFREEVLENSSSGAIAVDAKMAIDDKFSSSATLASDCLHREIVDLKQVIDKLGSQIRSKDAALKVIKDELKQEKLNGEILRRDNRQIGADAKANERYVKCVQIEYELLHNMASKSQEAFLAIGNESIRHATEFDKSAKMVKKQMKEIVEKNIEIRNLQEDIKRLHIDIANQRATAGVSTISLKLLQIELDHVSEKERRFTARIASLTERVERERHINKMLNQTAEETNLNAATSSEGIQIANQQQADLLIRLSKANNEIISLKSLLHDQQSVVAKEDMTMKCADNVDAGSFSSSRKRNNENSGVPTVDIKNAIPANNSIPASNGDNVNCQNSGEKPYVRTSLPSSQTTLMAAAATDREARTSPRHCLPLLQNADQVARTVHVVSSATDSSLMYSRSDDDNAQLDNDDRTCYASKASKRKRVDEADSGLDESFHHSVQEYRSDASTQASAAAEATIPADYGGSRREQVATVAHKALPAPKVEELDLDDDRCQICLDHPFGLMVLCAVCRRALHSACAKKGGVGVLTGKDFRCPQC